MYEISFNVINIEHSYLRKPRQSLTQRQRYMPRGCGQTLPIYTACIVTRREHRALSRWVRRYSLREVKRENCGRGRKGVKDRGVREVKCWKGMEAFIPRGTSNATMVWREGGWCKTRKERGGQPDKQNPCCFISARLARHRPLDV